MTIEFKNILDASADLVEIVRQWRNHKQISQYMLTNHVISKKEHSQWIEKLKTQKTAKTWIIQYNGAPIGVVSLANIDVNKKTTEWGFYISEETARGKGLGSEVLYHLMKHVFDEMKFKKMKTTVLENNPVALHLYEKFGFRKTGTMKEQLIREGMLVKVFLMSITENEWKAIKKQFKTLETEVTFS
jgi:UDP-4-amino-4,6-dideoxy-N-acetyl-beta-L-altrosamine N-acetyltransferase